ncbi:Uncharacterised protein [Mycobacterium tuberculosis]|uniref:Uncharacterized protein n=1 Tax=Mycobacterium tuberculosis TaxID=1773 RepID=A0A916LI71_MYCTX|nr:Uncharacterised protein [Mycobacterium tuberculosis]CPA82302.1 Uncharacterised protein [Mycobacterium tuberculosis]CPC17236.1 Uncharacterised protein [Mycobacterium tuberculosis]
MTGTQLFQAGTQLVDLFIATQAGQSGGQLIAAAQQFASAQIGGACGG